MAEHVHSTPIPQPSRRQALTLAAGAFSAIGITAGVAASAPQPGADFEPQREAMLVEIAGMPASSPEGLAAKARVVPGSLGDWDSGFRPFNAFDELLASLIRDCIGGA